MLLRTSRPTLLRKRYLAEWAALSLEGDGFRPFTAVHLLNERVDGGRGLNGGFDGRLLSSDDAELHGHGRQDGLQALLCCLG